MSNATAYRCTCMGSNSVLLIDARTVWELYQRPTQNGEEVQRRKRHAAGKNTVSAHHCTAVTVCFAQLAPGSQRVAEHRRIAPQRKDEDQQRLKFAERRIQRVMAAILDA
jgi:hypothetical protein